MPSGCVGNAPRLLSAVCQLALSHLLVGSWTSSRPTADRIFLLGIVVHWSLISVVAGADVVFVCSIGAVGWVLRVLV